MDAYLASEKDGNDQAPVEEKGTEEMEQKIGEIRAMLQAARDEELPVFISRWEKDTRPGVKALVEKAEKRRAAWERELERTESMKAYEKKYSSFSFICGIDEAGRGPLAGPVAAGAVILPGDCDILYLNDSKQLTEKKREELYDVIMEKALAAATGFVSPRRIDEINILQATCEAMRMAIDALKVKPDLLLNDAVTIPGVSIKQVPIIRGDAQSVSIAAASIIAKVERDRRMKEYDRLYPEYGFASNKGYGTRTHIEAIRKFGPSPSHRRSFIGNFL